MKGVGIYHIGPDGIYLYTGGRDRKASQGAFEPIFPDAGSTQGIETNGVSPVPAATTTLWLHQYLNRIYFHYGSGSMLVSDLDTNRNWYQKYDLQLTAPCTDKTNDAFLCGDSGKYVRQIEDPDATDDVGSTIAWEVQSMDYTLQTRRHFPRWAKYDVDVDDATSVEGKIILDDVTHHTHSITTSRDVTRRLIKTGNAKRCSIRLTGTGAVKLYAIEAE